MKLGPLWLDSSAEKIRFFSKTTLEHLRNKSPKIWNSYFEGISSEIGFKADGLFLGFSGKPLEISEEFTNEFAKDGKSRYSGMNNGRTGPEQCPENDRIVIGKAKTHLTTCSRRAVARYRTDLSQKPVDYLDCLWQIQSTTLTCRLPGLLLRKPVDTFVQSTAQFLLWETSRLFPPR